MRHAATLPRHRTRSVPSDPPPIHLYERGILPAIFPQGARMRVNRLVRVCFASFVWLLLAPSALLAQTSIAGIVRDSSSAVIPGVTVEAASPALIEKVRTVVTDGQGQYKIVDLRPGTYTVTFTLVGFNVVKR